MLPSNIDKEAWEGYLESRKAMKKPMTDRAKKMALKMLDNLAKQGEDPNMVLNQSEFCNYQGLFPVKPEFYKLMGVERESKVVSIIDRMNDDSWARG